MVNGMASDRPALAVFVRHEHDVALLPAAMVGHRESKRTSQVYSWAEHVRYGQLTPGRKHAWYRMSETDFQNLHDPSARFSRVSDSHIERSQAPAFWAALLV